MKRRDFDNEQDWLLARRGRITGSKLKDIYQKSAFTVADIKSILDERGEEYPKSAKKEVLESILTSEDKKKLLRQADKKLGFYELCAERLGVPADDESSMLRGKRLEEEAIQAFTVATEKEVDNTLMLWMRDDDESIAVSPDGMIGDTQAVEVKCLSSARHIQALIEQKIPDDYLYQVSQYFVVNETLEKLYFVFYDPRILAKPFFFLEVNREDVDVDSFLEYERSVLDQVNEIVNELSNF